MAYKKHIWKKGEIITPELLNNMEKAIEEAHKLLNKLLEKEEIKEKTKK